MPSKRYPQTGTVSFTDEAAWELMTAILTERPYKGRVIGERFLISDRAYFRGGMSNKSYPAWAPPIERYRLPIDDILLELMSRKRSPTIAEHRADNSDILKIHGPFFVTRAHLHNAVFGIANMKDEKEYATENTKLLADIDKCMEILRRMGGYPYRSFHQILKSPLERFRLQIKIASRLRAQAGQSSVETDSVDAWRQQFS
jgi:hypothetical protein